MARPKIIIVNWMIVLPAPEYSFCMTGCHVENKFIHSGYLHAVYTEIYHVYHSIIKIGKVVVEATHDMITLVCFKFFKTQHTQV